MYTIISESKIDIHRCNNQRSKYREVRKEDAMTCLVKKKIIGLRLTPWTLYQQCFILKPKHHHIN